MATELAHALITPYSLVKSRTGGIIGRMLSLTDLELVGARMYAPSNEFIDEYKATIERSDVRASVKRLFGEYLDANCRPANRLGKPNRMMLLLFRGENAVESLLGVVGPVTTEARGDTIRGTFGDFIAGSGEVSPTDGVTQVIAKERGAHSFEPAVLAAPDRETARAQLAIFAARAETDGGVLENLIEYPSGITPETTLVNLKPEHFAARSARPGNIIDMFSKTGLYIVGARLVQLSVDQANEFYGFLRGVFVEKLKGLVVRKLRGLVEEAGVFDFRVGDEHLSAMADALKEANAECEFGKIVEYMTGVSPEAALSAEARARPGRTKCLALLYQGEDAVKQIRARLGATNPELAEGGTVRHDYGGDLLRNGAHASDSPESAARERKIIGLAGDEAPSIVPIIREFLD